MLRDLFKKMLFSSSCQVEYTVPYLFGSSEIWLIQRAGENEVIWGMYLVSLERAQ